MPAPATSEKLQDELLSAFDRALKAECNKQPSLLIAFSGGLDSHVLLVIATQWCALNPHASLRAITIDHGLQADSAAWVDHSAAVCRKLGVNFDSVQVVVDSDSGLSPEEAARNARYQALSSSLREGEYLLSGHHADDQAETLLLQLLRGAGVRGLSAMPARKVFGRGLHLRPLLLISRESLQQFARQQRLQWIEDPSNDDNKFDRNLLRNSVLPVLRERWPAMARNLSRSAGHCAEAALLNRTLAMTDLGEAIEHPVIPLAILDPLSEPQRKNALRVWIEHHGYQPPSSAQLTRVISDLVYAARDSTGQVSFGLAQIRRYSGRLFLADRGQFEAPVPFDYHWNRHDGPLYISETQRTLRADEIDLPWLTDNQQLRVRNRAGGERLRLRGHAHSKSVKTLLQQNGIPPWERSRLPFIYVDNILVGIVGVGFSAQP